MNGHAHSHHNARLDQETLGSALCQPPLRYGEVHHSPINGLPGYPPRRAFVAPSFGVAPKRPQQHPPRLSDDNSDIRSSTNGGSSNNLASDAFARASQCLLNPSPHSRQQSQQDDIYDNPYKAPSYTNSSAFVPPKIKGYEFRGGSQAGYIGLTIGKRTSDGLPVLGKLHQSRILLQHEHRILKQLQIVDSSYDPNSALSSASASMQSSEGDTTLKYSLPGSNFGENDCSKSPGPVRANETGYEAGLVEGETYFNRIVEDFIDLDQSDTSIIIMRRLGPNLLSPQHPRFLGLEETDGHQSPEVHGNQTAESPFSEVHHFLVFCLKAASILEALQRSNLAHLALCPTAFHWEPPMADVTGPESNVRGEAEPKKSKSSAINPTSLYHDANSATTERSASQQEKGTQTSQDGRASRLLDWDVNRTRLRLFDFSHSKILSHERARAPHNIVEWQIPGYLEFHLQYLAPEQTGRAETWMDHRTDIYGLGATLFSLLTMQFPNRGSDSVQILQGVLSRDLPPLNAFRPDMPPVIDSILRKMTKKQPSQRYQTAFGFKQDIIHCLNELCMKGTIDSFPLGKHDVSYHFVLPNTVFGCHLEQQMISAAIAQAASAYQHSMSGDISDSVSEEGDMAAMKVAAMNDSDHYVFEDDIVSLQSQAQSKISLSSRTLLMTPKPFDGSMSVHRGSETSDPVVRAIFVSGPSGVGKTILIRGMATVARNSGLFAGGIFEAEGSEPYSAILMCLQSVLQQLLAQHTDALASLVVAIRTAFEPSSGIGIVCDLVPELKYFFNGSEIPKSEDVPLTHSVARFHALILKLIRVISTHFFMTWLIDDIHYADENSIALLATLVNVSKRLPIVLIMTHRDTVECLIKVKQILGGSNLSSNNHTGSYGSSGSVHHDPLVDEISSLSSSVSAAASTSKTTALRATGLPLVVRGGGGVRFIRLQNPRLEAIQEFLSALLHRDEAEVLSLAKVLHQKSWLTIRQLVLELYRNQAIYFNSVTRQWDWQSCPDKLAEVVRRLTGEEHSFLESRFRALDNDTKKTLICAAICGSIFTIHEIQRLASTAYAWEGNEDLRPEQQRYASETIDPESNKGCNAMAGLQSALKEGILVYTSIPDLLRWHHSVMRKVALELFEGTDEKERLHYEMAKILFKVPGQEFKTAIHILQCLDLMKKKIALNAKDASDERNEDDDAPPELDAQPLRTILSLAGEKSQKSGAQDMAVTYWYAALSLMPENCWDPIPPKDAGADGSNDNHMEDFEDSESAVEKSDVYHEALKLNLQCIEAERWRENFAKASAICETILKNITDPIDRARIYQHQIEIAAWAYSQPEKATDIAIQCMQELGMSKDVSFNPNQEEIREIYERTHKMLLEHMDELQSENPKICTDPKIIAMMEVLSISNASLYYSNVPFLAAGVAQSMDLVCKYGITKDAGRALVSFALTHSTWHGCLENAFELGKLACKVCNDNHHVKFLFCLTVQQWGDHIANSIPALEETLQAADLTCDRLFHTAGMIHVSVMRVLLGRVHLRDCMSSTIDLITKHIEFGPKSHGVEVMQGILQMIKCLKGQTNSSNPETMFDDNEFVESKTNGKRNKPPALAHNNSTFTMLKIVVAFIFGHYGFINEVTSTWHDDPKSMMNFEGSWISHTIFTVVGLSLVNILRTEKDPDARKTLQDRLFAIRDRMAVRASKFPTNHAAMFYLLEAEIADQALEHEVDFKQVLLLYEKAIAYATDGTFPLHKNISYEMAGKCHLRHGLVTSARCLISNARHGYQAWGARGKVLWFYETFPAWFKTPPEIECVVPARGLFYRPSNVEPPSGIHSLSSNATTGSIGGTTLARSSSLSSTGTSPWLSSSPKTTYSPIGYKSDSMSAAAAVIAQSCMATNLQSSGGSPANSSTGTSHLLQSTWPSSPKSPELENADLDVLDFSSVIEAMQVIASEIDLDLLLVKSLGVLNQSVGAKSCCVIISKDDKLVLAASKGDRERCESVNPPMDIGKCNWLFHGVINYVVNTSTPCLLTNTKDDPRFCADEYLKQRMDLKTVLCAPIMHKAALVGVLYMEDFPERAFANKRMLVMNLLVQQLGISITNALLYQSVQQSETKLNDLLENMPCGIALWDATAHHCQYINSSWSDMTGFSLQEILDSEWKVLTHEDEAAIYAQHWRERVQAGVPCQWESRYRLKDDTFRWALVRMLPIQCPVSNKVIQWLTVTIDIDDQRRAVQLKSNFLANMSHELRTPFSGILGMLSLLSDSSGLSHEQYEFVDMAKASCEMLIRIVDDLLNFSKLEADKVTLEYIPLCFEEILGDVCDLLVPLASRKGLELIILIDDTMPIVLIGDPDRMKQILMNLIGNAIKFSTTGNVVVEFWHELNKRQDIIRPKNERSPNSVLNVPSGGEMPKQKHEAELDNTTLGDEVILHCSVKDQGIGMTPEEQKMLFVSFQQTDNGTTRKYGGTGLGLSICAQLIAHMHGEVIVESEKGNGTTFTFTAKLRTDTPYDEENSPEELARIRECRRIVGACEEGMKGKKFLVLTPNKQLREQITRILRGSMYSEFDDVRSALASGTIMMTGECATPCQDMDINGVGRNNEMASDHPDDTNAIVSSSSGFTDLDNLTQFDFIIVDDVLDSAELDRIYPSPAIAFVLLLAPTTETLRWILPPAVKKVNMEPDEPESGDIDVGRRERNHHAAKVVYAVEKSFGKDQRVAYEVSPRRNSTTLAELSSGIATAGPAEVATRLAETPSQLFRKRKSSRHITVTRPLPHWNRMQSDEEPMMETSTFQVRRLIKPVRRMKLLQILYAALVRSEKPRPRSDNVNTSTAQGSQRSDPDGESSGYDYEEIVDERRRRSITEETSSVPISPSSGSLSPLALARSNSASPRTASPSPASSSSLKRRREQVTPDVVAGGRLTRRLKATKHNAESEFNFELAESSSLDPALAEKYPQNMGLSNVVTSGTNTPKRARNNDALLFLLTPEEQRGCRGKNVLVAEDDFVSQKILQKQLAKLGMNVVIANNGQEAINLWLSAERGFYTIAIFDHHMPIMDGLAATRKLRALEAEEQAVIRIPIVGLSADIQQSTKESCIKAGMDEYMTKPLLTKGLALLIQRYCSD